MMRTLFMILLAVSAHAESYRVCEFAAPVENLPIESLQHRRNRLVTSFEAHHSVNDAIATLGHDIILEGKFSYGLVGKDLVDEVVEVWLDVCKEKLALAHRGRTDKSGVLRWTLPSEVLETPGEYKVVMRVVGDGTSISSTIRLLPSGAKVAIFDIDGTLTATEIDVNLEVISDLIGGTYSPPTRESSAELSRYLHDNLGFEIVYLTGRHYFLNDLSKTWLARNNFARGTLVITRSLFDIYPTNSSVGKFKINALKQIKAGGLVLDRAYGNAPTDVFAYQAAGIANERIYVVGKNSGSFGAVGIGTSFLSHYQDLLNGESDGRP